MCERVSPDLTVYLRPLFDDDDFALEEVEDLGGALLATSSSLDGLRLRAGLLVPVGSSSWFATLGLLLSGLDLLPVLLLAGLLSLSATLALLLSGLDLIHVLLLTALLSLHPLFQLLSHLQLLPHLLVDVTFALLPFFWLPDDPPCDRSHLVVSSLVALAARPARHSPSA